MGKNSKHFVSPELQKSNFTNLQNAYKLLSSLSFNFQIALGKLKENEIQVLYY